MAADPVAVSAALNARVRPAERVVFQPANIMVWLKRQLIGRKELGWRLRCLGYREANPGLPGSVDGLI
jgi:hypothetical protein